LGDTFFQLLKTQVSHRGLFHFWLNLYHFQSRLSCKTSASASGKKNNMLESIRKCGKLFLKVKNLEKIFLSSTIWTLLFYEDEKKV